MVKRTGRKPSDGKPKTVDDNLSLRSLDFETFVAAAMATGKPPKAKPQKKRDKKVKR